MDETQATVRIAAIIAVTVVTVVLIIGSCTGYQSYKRTEILQACLERTEHVSECILYGDPAYSARVAR